MIKMEKILSTGLCQLQKKAVLRYVCVIRVEYVLGMCSHLHLKVKKLQHSREKFLAFTYLTLFCNASDGILNSSSFRLFT